MKGREFCDLSGYLGDLPHRGASENIQKGRDVAQGQVGFDLGLSVPTWMTSVSLIGPRHQRVT